MLSLPTESSTPVMPLVTEFERFDMLVEIPPAAVSACSLKEVMEPPPVWSSSIILLSSSSMLTVASALPPPSAVYRSLAVAPAPSIASASWFICPGMACVRLFQSCISGLPLDRICRNCSIAALVSCVELPDAMSMSFSARPASVAWSRSPVTATMPWTVDAMSSSLVGRLERRSLILEMDDPACVDV